MTAPPRRRALPAVIFIGILVVLTAVVWVRVLSGAASPGTSPSSSCTTPAPPVPSVLPRPTAVSVIVLNGTDRAKLAAHTKTGMTARGFRVVQIGNDEPSYGGHGILTGVGEIRYGPTAAAAAELVHYYLPGARMVATDSSASTVILALGTTFQHLLLPAQVASELAAHHARMTTSSPPPVPVPTPTC